MTADSAPRVPSPAAPPGLTAAGADATPWLGLPPTLARVVGGPRGRLAEPPASPAATLAPLVALSAVPVVLGLLRQAHCLTQGWTGNTPLYRGCYSDVLASVQTAHLDRGLAAYLDGQVPLDAPPLAGMLLSFVGGLAPGSGLLSVQRGVVALWAVLGLVLVAVAALAVATARLPRTERLAASVALSPVVGLTLFLGPEILAATLVATGLWAWSRRRSRLAGVLLGLAVAAGTWPVLVLAALGLVAREHRRRAAYTDVLLGAGAAVVCVALFFVGSPSTLLSSYAAWWSGPVGNGSPLYLFSLAGRPVDPAVGAGLAVVGWVLAAAAVRVLLRGAYRAPSVAQVALVALVVVLVTGKAFPLQASMALVPLVALAGVRWRFVLLWWLAEAVHYAALWMHVSSYSDANHSLPGPWYTLALLARVVAVGALAWSVWNRLTDPLDEPALEPALDHESSHVPVVYKHHQVKGGRAR